jgi:uncharacterized protein (UPF0276 family)
MFSPPFGIGFRSTHFQEIVEAPRAVDWFEVIADNFVGVGGPRRAMLERLRADYPILLHGVSLSIAGDRAPSKDYLRGLRNLADWLEPTWVSDHLCWTSLRGHQSHDLLPVAYTAEVLDHVADRVARVQDALGHRLLLENPSAYVAFRGDEMGEAEFFAALHRRTGCGMLLDVNNLYVNANNLGLDAESYLDRLPDGIVGYIHLAGHAVLEDVRIDTHDAEVSIPVWNLFGRAVRRFAGAGVIIERDDNLPTFERLAEEVEFARTRHAAEVESSNRASSPQPASEPALLPSSASHVAGPAPKAARWNTLRDAFWHRLVDKPLGVDHGDDPDLPELLADDRPVRAARGMRVYGDAYTANLRRALAVNFPALARVIRSDEFDRLAAVYLRRHPPRGHGFARLGAQLAAFVTTFPFAADYGVEPVVLSQLAALEQAQIEVLDEADEPAGIAPKDLAAIGPTEWDGARFGFVRSLRLVRATHDVLAVIEAVARGESPERPAAMAGAYLVCRSEDRLCTQRIGFDEAAVLAGLMNGLSFGEACACMQPGADEARLAECGARALFIACSLGLVSNVHLRAAA